MNVEWERDGRVAQLIYSFRWVETSGHPDLVDALTERADVTDDMDIPTPGQLRLGDGPFLPCVSFCEKLIDSLDLFLKLRQLRFRSTWTFFLS